MDNQLRSKMLYRFTIGKPLQVAREWFDPPYSNDLFATIALGDFYDTEDPVNSYIFTNHQIKASVKMDQKSTLNQAKIILYNLDPEVTDYLRTNQSNNLVCILEAGDNVQGLKEIFKGTLGKLDIQETDTEIMADMQLIDGGVNVRSAQTNRAYPRGTTYETILKDLNRDLRLPVGMFAAKNDQRLLSNITLFGRTQDIYQQWAEDSGLDFMITRGEINVMPKTERIETEVSIITKDSGLIGKITPLANNMGATASDPSRQGSNGVQFKCLLDGSLAPNETVYLKDGDYDGAYKLQIVNFEIDYEGLIGVCECTAIQVEGVLKS